MDDFIKVEIPIRPGVTVWFNYLPGDLAPEEAAKIARVVEALATPDTHSQITEEK